MPTKTIWNKKFLELYIHALARFLGSCHPARIGIDCPMVFLTYNDWMYVMVENGVVDYCEFCRTFNSISLCRPGCPCSILGTTAAIDRAWKAIVDCDFGRHPILKKIKE